jgi:ABC-type bacteriocin/lantibiotic exporter with double-glycine peptidase domain
MFITGTGIDASAHRACDPPPGGVGDAIVLAHDGATPGQRRADGRPMNLGHWWGPPRDDLSHRLVHEGMPAGFLGLVRRVGLRHQVQVSLLAIAVFVLNTAPLEMQRRILNAAVPDGDLARVVALALVYAAIVLGEGFVKLLMNIYGGWIGEKAIRALRLAASRQVESIPAAHVGARVQGVEISMILAEPEPIGGFVGVAISELVLQIGILASVFGYMLYMQPSLALVCLAIFSPQFVFVPLMQSAINRRVQGRIAVLREASAGVILAGSSEAERAQRRMQRFAEIFELNLGIIKLRFSMKFLMNLTQNLGKVTILCVGGWYVINGRTDIGTVVAFVSGLNNVRDPWGDLVNWYQDMMLARAKYRMFVTAMDAFAVLAIPSE